MQFGIVVVRSRGGTWRKSIIIISSMAVIALILIITNQDRRQAIAVTATDYISSVFPSYSSEGNDPSPGVLRSILPTKTISRPGRRKSKTQKMYIPVRFNPQATEDDVMKEMIMRWGKIIDAIEALRRTLACIDHCTNISAIPGNNEVEISTNETDVNATILGLCLDTCGADAKPPAGNNRSVTSIRNFYISQLAAALAQRMLLNDQLRSLAHKVVAGGIAPIAAASKLQSLFLSSSAMIPAGVQPSDGAGEWIYVDGSEAFARSTSTEQWRVARIGAVADSGLNLGDMIWMESPFRRLEPSDPAPQVRPKVTSRSALQQFSSE